jgi:uncharacterized delta-60 repeat protein
VWIRVEECRWRWCLSGLLLLLAVWGVLPGESWPQVQEAGTVVPLSDGKIVVVASGGFAVARYRPDGRLDPSFGIDGKVVTRLGTTDSIENALVSNDAAAIVALQNDGKIVAAGRSDKEFAVVRYNADGSLDPSFGRDGKVKTRLGTEEKIEDAFARMALQDDGKIVVVGRSWQEYSNDIAVVRYNPDGTLDASFGHAGKVMTNFPDPDGKYGYDEAFAVAVQADGKLVVGGTRLVRYNPDGTLDASFGRDGQVETEARALALQRDGKLVVIGVAGPFALARYNFNGTLDPSFGSGGAATTQLGKVYAASDVALQADGKLVVVGTSFTGRSFDFAMVRYTPNGTLDPSFGQEGKVTSDFCADTIEERYAQQIGPSSFQGGWRVGLQADGKILVTGTASDVLCSGYVMFRYNSDGSLDATFGENGRVTIALSRVAATGEAAHSESDSHPISAARANALALQTNGKFIVAGGISRRMSNMSWSSYFALVRYQPNGDVDLSFGAEGKLVTEVGEHSAEARALALQPDGKIVVAGTWYSQQANSSYGEFTLVRYQPDGHVDQSFGQAGKVMTRIGDGLALASALAVQRDRKIVVAGTFNDKFVVVRYQPNGALDPHFGSAGKVITPVGVSGGAAALAFQPDGKIVVAGSGDNNFALIRYQADGHLDPSFGNGGLVTTEVGEWSGAAALALRPDGKIVVAGSTDGSIALIRYQADGHLDPSFGDGGTVITHPDRESYARAVAVQRDGKIIVAGDVSSSGYIPDMGIGSYDGVVVQYQANGTVDPQFGTEGVVISVHINKVHALALQPDGKILVAGEALVAKENSEEETPVFALARYNSDGSLDVTFGADGKVNTHFSVPAK